LWGPLQVTESVAATSSDVARASAAQEGRAAANAALKQVATHRSRHLRRHAWRHTHRSAALRDKAKAESKTETKAETKVAAIDVAANETDLLPASVANAKAQLQPSEGGAGDVPAAKSDRGRGPADAQNSPPSAADAAIVASDELNDIDLAVTETFPRPAPKIAGASIAPADEDTWSKTSIIGKLFIAFGGLLTLASAARMFMA
jgi:hypothetical protein